MRFLRIGVISRSMRLVSTRRLLAAIRRSGHIAHLLDPMDTHFEIQGSGILSIGKEIPRLHGVIPRVGVQSADYVLSLVQQLETLGVVSLNQAKHMAIARNKLRTLQQLAQVGIPIPKTAYGSFCVPSSALVASVGGAPVIIKTLDGSQGVGVMLAHTEAQAESIMAVLKQARIEFVVQEYISESEGCDVRCFVVGGEVVGAMQRQGNAGEFRSNLHRGGSATPYFISAMEAEMAVHAARTIGLSVAGVDLIPSNTGMKVIEVNCSPGLEGIENTLNKDIAMMVVSHLLERIQASL